MNSSIGPLAAIFAAFFLALPVTASACDAAETVAAAADGNDTDTQVTQKEQTLDAEKAAANNAADRLLENTRLDLDIRLIGHSSKTVAATR
jgi:hypothetical protein